MSNETETRRTQGRAKVGETRTSDYARGADYEIKSGGGSIVGALDFESKEQAEAVLKNFLSSMMSTSSRRESGNHRGGPLPA
ncbi:hypothetical protein [Arthrobacter sp. HMWF013]|uniref:hypothetical protein n=1 Tax=Arthrobacter sp. HMWF013 TaxID=2056849 RepID=UPI0011B1EE87|nr:hypothetical protein [Arthrobacter sp. HMWF013]